MTILSIYNFASCLVVLVALTEINYTDFVNRSIITQIELFFLSDFVGPNTKLQANHSHFQFGTKCGFNKPPNNQYSVLTC